LNFQDPSALQGILAQISLSSLAIVGSAAVNSAKRTQAQLQTRLVKGIGAGCKSKMTTARALLTFSFEMHVIRLHNLLP